MTLSHIVAAAENDVIGVNNDLPWNIPEDMQFFRDKTKGHAIIMGRKTFESLGRALPHRLNVVITRQPEFSAPGAVVVPTLEAAIDYCRGQTDKWGDEVFIIGGGEIYRQSLELVDLVYLTRVHKAYDGTVKYPKVTPDLFTEVERRERDGYTFLTYKRKRDQ